MDTGAIPLPIFISVYRKGSKYFGREIAAIAGLGIYN